MRHWCFSKVDWPGNRLGVVIDVEALVNGGRDCLNLGTQVPLNVVKVESVLPVDQVDSQTKMAIPTRSPNAMKVRLGVFRKVKVDDNVDSLNIDTTSE